MTIMRTTTKIAVALAAAASLFLGGASHAGAAVHVKETLKPTSQAPRARGSAKLTVRHGSKGVFSIATRRLAKGASFDVVVGGIKVGALTTNAKGAGKTTFGAPKHGNRAFLGFDPRGQSLAVRDHDGHDVLDGDMPDDDAGKVACCLPDDDGVECDDRTPERCAAEGGTPSSVSGCFPDPCNANPGTSVCCTVDSTCGAFVDDDPEVGCHAGTSPAECAEHHGTVVDAASCDPNPCAAVPPVALVTCCVPDDDEIECQFRTADRCAAKGGTVVAAASCDPNPCGGTGMSHDDEPGNDDDQGDDHDGDGGNCGHHHHGGDGDHDGGDGDHHGGDD